MPQITSHKVDGLNEFIDVAAEDPGPDGGTRLYSLQLIGPGSKGLSTIKDKLRIHFQDGPIGVVGLNGFSTESILAVLIHRLQGFQSGEFKCRENAIALTHLEDAMHWLHHRTRERAARGVEGTFQV